MKLIRLTDKNSPEFLSVLEWNYNWWGVPQGKSYNEVKCQMEHSLCAGDKLPQTFVALDMGEPVGVYQLSMVDDLAGRPDIYPWLINVFVPNEHRGKNICREMMNSVKENAKKAGIKELYLYTSHVGLYEKFGWEFVEFVDTFKENSEKERLYKLIID